MLMHKLYIIPLFHFRKKKSKWTFSFSGIVPAITTVASTEFSTWRMLNQVFFALMFTGCWL